MSGGVITGIEGAKNLQALSERLGKATAHRRGEVLCDLDHVDEQLVVTVAFGPINEEKTAAIWRRLNDDAGTMVFQPVAGGPEQKTASVDEAVAITEKFIVGYLRNAGR